MPSSFAPNEQTVISKRAPLPVPSETLSGSRASQIGKSLEGQKLGQFMLEEFVGGGGMGAVFRAIDTTLDRIVAVKVVSNEQTDEDTLRRFRNEAQSAARLDHPNIATVYSVGDESGWNYIVFEFIEGVNVRDLVAHKGPLPLDEAISYVMQVGDALEHASQRNVVHRDIKPSNVLVMQDGRAKLVDMGLARLHHVESTAEDLTATGVTLGTFDYISPEQARDPREADVRSDLYSLGCTFYYMLTGMPPFPEGTVLQKLLSHNSESPPDPRDLRADLPPDVSTIAMKLMAKLPNQRYQRPSELTTELMKLCEKLGFVVPVGRGMVLPSRDSVFAQLAHHIPWFIPVCLLIALVFGVDAVLPRSNDVPQSDLMKIAVSPSTGAAPRSVEATGEDTQRELPAPVENPSEAGNSRPPHPKEIKTKPTPVTRPQEADPGTTSSSSVVPSSRAVANGANGKRVGTSSPEAAPVLKIISTDEAIEVEPEAEASFEAGNASAEESDAASPQATASAAGTVSQASDRLVVIPEGPPTPNPDPMVVSSLEAALRRAADQPEIRVIELRCDRYEAKPLTIDLRNNLTIEAGKGFLPLLVFDRRDASVQGERRMMHLLGGRLTLRGVHFHFNLPYTSEQGWALFHLHQVQELTLEMCTLTVQNDHRAEAAFFHIQSPRLPDMPVPGSNVPVPPRPNLVLKSCIARGEATFVRATEGLPFKLDFTQGMLATTERMIELGQLADEVPQEIARVNLRHVTAEMGLGLCRATQRDADARLPQLLVNAENCLLDHNASVPLIEHIGIRDAAGTMGYAIDLAGEFNVYPRTEILWRIEPRGGSNVEVLWNARFDSENSWYKDKPSERYAQWLDSARGAERVMHQVTPTDYLVAGDDELGFDSALLPKLPPALVLPDGGD